MRGMADDGRMRALSVKQPWAWSILQGGKPVENRSRATHHRGLLIIQASQSPAPHARVPARAAASQWKALGGTAACWNAISSPSRGAYVGTATSALIGAVTVVGCHQASGCCRPWGEAAQPGDTMWHWELENPRMFAHAIPAHGHLGIWPVPDTLATRVGRALRSAR
jgi:hypothetical protein